jgi:hypothetical protein
MGEGMNARRFHQPHISWFVIANGPSLPVFAFRESDDRPAVTTSQVMGAANANVDQAFPGSFVAFPVWRTPGLLDQGSHSSGKDR